MTGVAAQVWPVLRAFAALAVTLVALLAITFAVGRAMPIDPVVVAVGDRASPETYAKAREELGLDRPFALQFLIYLKAVASGDLGLSISSNQPVARDIARVFPATIELSTLGIAIGVIFGIPLGAYAAYWRNRWQDQIIRCVALFGYSAPVFWLGLIALLVFYSKLGIVGGPGRIDIAYRYSIEDWSGFLLLDTLRAGNMPAFRNALSHIVLPAVLLGYFSMAYIARMTRGFVIEELGKEYIVTARVKGASETRVLWCHAFPNVLVPVVTVVALAYAQLLEGTVLTEIVFAWPGLGLYITNSLFAADLPAVLGGTLVVGSCFVVLNKLSEFLYPVLDPRTERP